MKSRLAEIDKQHFRDVNQEEAHNALLLNSYTGQFIIRPSKHQENYLSASMKMPDGTISDFRFELNKDGKWLNAQKVEITSISEYLHKKINERKSEISAENNQMKSEKLADRLVERDKKYFRELNQQDAHDELLNDYTGKFIIRPSKHQENYLSASMKMPDGTIGDFRFELNKDGKWLNYNKEEITSISEYLLKKNNQIKSEVLNNVDKHYFDINSSKARAMLNKPGGPFYVLYPSETHPEYITASVKMDNGDILQYDYVIQDNDIHPVLLENRDRPLINAALKGSIGEDLLARETECKSVISDAISSHLDSSNQNTDLTEITNKLFLSIINIDQGKTLGFLNEESSDMLSKVSHALVDLDRAVNSERVDRESKFLDRLAPNEEIKKIFKRNLDNLYVKVKDQFREREIKDLLKQANELFNLDPIKQLVQYGGEPTAMAVKRKIGQLQIEIELGLINTIGVVKEELTQALKEVVDPGNVQTKVSKPKVSKSNKMKKNEKKAEMLMFFPPNDKTFSSQDEGKILAQSAIDKINPSSPNLESEKNSQYTP